jgi:major membrane immunogen (membrane-anchored lipoprotein)
MQTLFDHKSMISLFTGLFHPYFYLKSFAPQPVTFYATKRSAECGFDEIEVTDDQGVIPVLDTSTDAGGDNVLSPGETWTYTASEAARDLNEVIDFEQFSAGDQDGTINAGLSGVTVSTDWKNGLMIFDSANITGDPDDDLGTPNADFGGPGNGFGGEAGTPGENSIPQGQVLIFSQDGDPTDPNDNREGGTITFDWETPVRINQIGVLDVDTNEPGGTVVTYDANDNPIGTYNLIPLGDNSFQIVTIGDINVSRMDVNFASSAALTEIDFDNFYQNIGTVTVDGVHDSDPSSYFNPFVGPKDPEPQGVTPTQPQPKPDGSLRYEAEDLHLDGYQVEQADFASDGGLVAISDHQGSVSTTFQGEDGQYQLTVAAFDEKDGQSPVQVLINGQPVGAWTLDQHLGGNRASAQNQVVQTFTVDLEKGDTIEIQGTRNAGERARLDYFELHPTSPTSGGQEATPEEPAPEEPAPQEPSPSQPSTGSEDSFRYEAEDLHLDGYQVEQADFASDGGLVAISDHQGSVSTTFQGEDGQYQLKVAAFDEKDGQSPVQVLINGQPVGAWTLDQHLGGNRASAQNQVVQTFTVDLEKGDTIEIQGTRNAGERARLDYFELHPTSPTSGGQAPVEPVEPVEPVNPGPTQPTATANPTVHFWEAEDLSLHNYQVESKPFASGGQMIALNDEQGSASTTFDGEAGDYTLTVNAFDENDGKSPIKVLVNGVEMGEEILNQNLGGTRASATNLVSKTFNLNNLKPGDTIEIQGTIEAGERARIDSAVLAPESVNLMSSTPKDELLSGGLEADLFSFTAPSGDDIVQNFNQGVDQLLINIDGIDSFDDLNITSSGSNTVVTFPGIAESSVTLAGVNTLVTDDVLFS